MKHYTKIALLSLLLVGLMGCSSTKANETESTARERIQTSVRNNQIRSTFEEHPITYETMSTNDNSCGASLTLDESLGTFSLMYDPLSSYIASGPYTIKDNIITATTLDKLYTYKFYIVNDIKIKFIKEGSSSTSLIDSSFGTALVDGMTFFYSEDKTSNFSGSLTNTFTNNLLVE